VQQNLVGAHDACLEGTGEPFGCRRRAGRQERVVIQKNNGAIKTGLQLDRIRTTDPQLVVPRRPGNGCEPLTEHPPCPLDVRRQLANVTGCHRKTP
jgi:hypothetical protein